MNPLTQSKNTTILIALTLACFAFSPHARAVCQDGCLEGTNTVLGEDALINNPNLEATENTAVGFQAMQINTAGFGNTAIGYQTLHANTSGSANTAIGRAALILNTSGDRNTANGYSALFFNTTGRNNVAVGSHALDANSTGSNNIAVGVESGHDVSTGSYNIEIGHRGFGEDSGTIRIGTAGRQTNTYVAGISGATVPAGIGVIVDTNGHLGTTTSSARFKEAIKPMDKASEAILALKPVTFHYKKELDPNGIAQFGLVAGDVEKVNPDLVACDEQGKPYTVRYEAVNAMLLNEFLKEHRKVQDLEKQVEKLTAGLQKVSDQLELSKPAPHTVLNDQ